MKRRIHSLLAGAALLIASAPAYVHHSGAMFDSGREQTIKGTITEFNWTNPHSSFKVDVKGADGKVETWAIEMNSPGNLVRGLEAHHDQVGRPGQRRRSPAA